MFGLIIRIAMLGGALLVLWNAFAVFAQALRSPKQSLSLSKDDRDLAAARDMATAALKKVTTLKADIAVLEDGALWTAAEALAQSVERLVQAMLANPAGHRRARRHLSQLLFGAKAATRKFARVHAIAPDPDRKASFIALLDDLRAAFDQATADYVKSDIANLKIEEAVLRDLVARATRNDR